MTSFRVSSHLTRAHIQARCSYVYLCILAPPHSQATWVDRAWKECQGRAGRRHCQDLGHTSRGRYFSSRFGGYLRCFRYQSGIVEIFKTGFPTALGDLQETGLNRNGQKIAEWHLNLFSISRTSPILQPIASFPFKGPILWRPNILTC